MVGIEPRKWLEKIDDDQNLKALTELDDNRKDQQGRHYFLSQEIQPVVVMGGFSDDQGRIVLHSPSWRDSMVPNSSWTTTSAAALTLTCPTGHRYRVYYAGCRNATQATGATLSGTIGGNAWTAFNSTGTQSVQSTITLIGGESQTDAVVGQFGEGNVKEIWLNAADTLTMTLGTFAAGNNTEHMFMFEDYTL